MTSPAGEIRITAHVDTKPVEPELKEGLKTASTAAEGDLRTESGPKLGKALGDGIEDDVSKRGHSIAKSLEKALTNEHVAFRNVDFDNNEVQHAFRRVVSGMVDEFEQAFIKAGGSSDGGGGGGIFSGFTSGFRDAIGAGFNVSGKSPLVGALIPVFGALALAITAAVQAANGLVAVLTTIPAALVSIGIEAGIVLVAFHGLGDAIQGALAAKNAKELKTALEGLTPAARDFVTQLVPTLKTFMKTFAFDIQQAFFDGFGSKMVPYLLTVIHQQFLGGIVQIAGSIGDLFKNLVTTFATRPVVNFISALLPLIDKWIREMNPALFYFIQGLANFAYTTLPFFSRIGTGIANLITKAGEALDNLSHNTHFKRWLDDMIPTLKKTADLLGAAFDFVVSVVDQLNQSGGAGVIEFLTGALESLAAWFASPLGGAAIEGFIDTVKFLTILFIGLVAAITLVFDAITGLKYAFIAVGDFILGVVNSVLGWFSKDLPEGFKQTTKGLIDEVNSWGPKILQFFKDILPKLFDAGVSMVTAIAAGVHSAWDLLGREMKHGLAMFTDWLPGSPAKVGPLSGQGYSYLRGQRMVKDFARGVATEVPTLASAGSSIASTINFGRDAISVNYNGVSPTPEEARMTGSAIGDGVAGQLASRNDAIAVRTL